MLFGSTKDFNLINGLNEELLSNVLEQEILYYKISLEETVENIYGESVGKKYWIPVKLNCLIVRGDQAVTVDDFGPDLNRPASFGFLRKSLVDANVVPEVGDVVLWDESYYEVDTVRENQLFVGRDSSYNLTSYGSKYGSSLSIIVDCHMTRAERVGITEVR